MLRGVVVIDTITTLIRSDYFLLTFLVLVVLFVGTVLGYTLRERIALGLQEQMYVSLELYGRRRMTTVSWDMTQEELQCCGVEDYRDWNDRIPDSCCLDDYGARKRPCQQVQNSLTIYQTGCYQAITQELMHNAALLGLVAMLLFVAIIPATVMAYYMLTVV
ncbi:tetraspanin-9-like [Anopheles aquasalis]|uniref:tetraspanin-9-like n=1 Tax=Anopheles aquasalis TaxID=42839 RepID=UPI00215B6667|nr:tetraspanin-9-like [Anopheles aquasalis]